MARTKGIWNYLDLFSGIGGFHLGLERAGFKFNWTSHSEIDKYAEQVHKRHWPESEALGDINKIRVDRILKEVQRAEKRKVPFLTTFGFPCQDLSMVGKQTGLHGERSGLFFKAMQIIGVTKPNIFIFENVKGLLMSNKGKDFEVVLQTIADLGIYDCEWQLINTRWFLPQNRERVYFVGHLRGRSRPKVFPIEKDIEKTFTCRGNKHLTQIGVYSIETPGLLWKSREQCMMYEESLCLRTIKEHGITDKKTYIRYLTPVEYARLQGFPDDWHDGLDDAQAYKCYGNAVSIPVVEEIGKKLLL